MGEMIKSLPYYQDPITLSPPLKPQLEKCCQLSSRVGIIRGAVLDSGRLWAEPYDRYDPGLAPDEIERVVLELEGSVSGVQYDRYGSVWVGGFELLRTTTPEPGAEGAVTSWRVERDVTDYRSALVRGTGGGEGPSYAAISIPNFVNSEYTGAIHANVSLAFYASKEVGVSSGEGRMVRSPPIAIHVNPNLTDALRANGTEFSWNDLATTTNSLRNYTLRQADLLRQPLSSSSSIGRIFLDVSASAHGDEEFYYSKFPKTRNSCDTGNTSQRLDCFEGGPLRFLRIKIDGQLAGAVIPFPSVYTGGINPMLWRPLTGIESFDIVPYRFDLSPFRSIFNGVMRGESTSVTVGMEVVTGEELEEGADRAATMSHDRVWYLDGTLFFYPHGETTKRALPHRRESVSTIVHSPLNVSTDVVKDRLREVFLANSYKFSVVASSPDGHLMNVSYELASSAFLFPDDPDDPDSALQNDDGYEVSNGTARQKIVTMTQVDGTRSNNKDGNAWLIRTSMSEYNYLSNATDKADNTTFDLSANISWSRDRFEEYKTYSLGANNEKEDSSIRTLLNVSWSNSIEAFARYNRSLTNHSDVHIAEGHSHEVFRVSSSSVGKKYCYDGALTASNGSVVNYGPDDQAMAFDYDCHFPLDLYFCGQELCGFLDFDSRFRSDGGAKERRTNPTRHGHAFLIFLGCFLVAGSGICWMFKRHRSREYTLSLVDLGGNVAGSNEQNAPLLGDHPKHP